MKPIYILSGPIQTGKTTKLFQWAATQKNIDGILQPVIDNKRFIYHIASRTLKQLETERKENVTSIGKYNFSNDTFKWAIENLSKSFKQNLDWLLIDEVGPIELTGKGLEPVITNIINEKERFKGKILFVVRENLLRDFLLHYKIENNYELMKL